MRCQLLTITVCVLAPLAAALGTCDSSLSQAFQAKPSLDEGLLQTFDGKKFWVVASGEEGDAAVKIEFQSVTDNYTIDRIVTIYDSEGNIYSSQPSTFILEGNHILVYSTNVSIYFFKCSKNIIGGYRCAYENLTGDGPNYFMWAAWDQSEDDVRAEVATCTAEFTKIDTSAVFITRVHPRTFDQP